MLTPVADVMSVRVLHTPKGAYLHDSHLTMVHAGRDHGRAAGAGRPASAATGWTVVTPPAGAAGILTGSYALSDTDAWVSP
jgi:hypothetical protein